MGSPGPLLLDYGTRLGARALGLQTGVVAPGQPADFIGVNVNHQALAGWNGDDFLDVLFFGASSEVITQTWVGGRKVSEK
jgi:formimidoylglutamate deiminase